MPTTTIAPAYEVAAFDLDSREALMNFLRGLKSSDVPHLMHLHEYREGEHDSGHTFDECIQANATSLRLANARLFGGTYHTDTGTLIAYGFVAAKL